MGYNALQHEMQSLCSADSVSYLSVRFRLIDKENIEFKQFGLRDNVAQLSVFEVHHLLPEVGSRSSEFMLINLSLCICSTPLHFCTLLHLMQEDV